MGGRKLEPPRGPAPKKGFHEKVDNSGNPPSATWRRPFPDDVTKTSTMMNPENLKMLQDHNPCYTINTCSRDMVNKMTQRSSVVKNRNMTTFKIGDGVMLPTT